MSLSPILNSTYKSKILILGYQRFRNKEYGQIGIGGKDGLGMIKTPPLPWEEAQQLFRYLETKIQKTIETHKEK